MLAERARIVLACAEPGSGVARVAAELGSTRMTVRKWRLRFAEDGSAATAAESAVSVTDTASSPSRFIRDLPTERFTLLLIFPNRDRLA